MRRCTRSIAAVAIAIGALVVVVGGGASAGAQAGFPLPVWTDTIGPIALSSPTVATLDGVTAIVFGTESGYVYAVNATSGALLPGWPEPVELAPGVPSAIESTPTVAYLNGPNSPPSIVVGAGSTYVVHQQGGLEAFNADGSVRFRFATADVFNEWSNSPYPDGYDEAVFSTPAIGDITGNGTEDIVFGSYDHRLYALDSSGNLVHGFPIDTEDTIWSSPALFHVRGSANLEDIFIGGDASGAGGCHGGFIYDFTYRAGAPHLMWRHCENQTIWSSPAVGVINSTGRPAVVVGTGFGETPPYKSDTDKLFAFYAGDGGTVPGWPVTTTGPTFGSPAIGMLAGGTPAVVDTSWCLTACGTTSPGFSRLFAWTGGGQLIWSQTLRGPNDFSSPILVDLTGSGTNDVLVGSATGLFPISGVDGSFMFGTSENTAINTCSVQSTAAVTDVAGVGWRLYETCGGPQSEIKTGRLIAYPLAVAPAVNPPWPMWRADANHDGVLAGTLVPTLSRELAREKAVRISR